MEGGSDLLGDGRGGVVRDGLGCVLAADGGIPAVVLVSCD